jgi:hypothetical protein
MPDQPLRCKRTLFRPGGEVLAVEDLTPATVGEG